MVAEKDMSQRHRSDVAASVMAALKRTNESGVVSLPCFLKSLNPLRLMVLNAKKMTTSHCFENVFAAVVRACADM